MIEAYSGPFAVAAGRSVRAEERGREGGGVGAREGESHISVLRIILLYPSAALDSFRLRFFPTRSLSCGHLSLLFEAKMSSRIYSFAPGIGRFSCLLEVHLVRPVNVWMLALVLVKAFDTV